MILNLPEIFVNLLSPAFSRKKKNLQRFHLLRNQEAIPVAIALISEVGKPKKEMLRFMLCS